MTSYYRVMLGQKSAYADQCIAEGFIGAHYDIDQDLTDHLPDEWRQFNKAFIPKYLAIRPEKTRIGAGLACGALWTVAKGISIGDVVLSPNGNGQYFVGEVTGGYAYHPDRILPHRRSVKWSQNQIDRALITPELRRSLGSIGTVSNITQYANEIATIIGQEPEPLPHDIDDPFSFALEAHLEDFLVKNWTNTEFGKDYDIFELDGVLGKQFPTDTGPLDILAISKDKKR
ncbi:MAG: restriction endonuclease, partial [Armatimonadota bacterium]